MSDTIEIMMEQIADLIKKMHAAGYGEVKDALTNLNNLLKKFYTPNSNGVLPAFDKKDQKELMTAYIVAAGAIQNTLAQKELPEALATISQSVKNLLTRDITVIGSAKPDNTTLPEILAQARTVRVFANEQEKVKNKMGDAFSVRIPLQINVNGRDRKGFFTSPKYVVPFSADKAKKILKKLKTKDENLAKRLNMNNGELENDLNGFFDFLDKDFLKFSKYVSKFIDYVDQASESGDLKEGSASILRNLDDPEWTEFIKDYETSSRYHQTLQADNRSCITERNIAMSRVASLLGLDSLIAQSSPMEMTDEQGNLIKGVFMEEAEGKDLKYLTPEEAKKLDKKALFTPSCIKQAAELQILDFICQNIDRHPLNMFYKFNKEGTKIIGIQGIDNDMSFGKAIKYGDTFLHRNDFTFNGLKVISESLKNHIFALKPDMLEYCLKDVGLTKDEINAAISRLNQVREGIEYHAIQVLNDQAWEKLNIEQMGKENPHSIFHTLTGERMQKDLNSHGASRKKVNYVAAEVVNGLDAHTLEKNFQKAVALSERIERSQLEIRGDGSAEFRWLQDSVKAYKQLTETMQEKKDPDQEIKMQADQEMEMQTVLNDMRDAANAYLQKKGNHSINRKTQKRIAIAKEVQNFVKQKKKEYEEFSNQRNLNDKIKGNRAIRDIVSQ